MRAKGTLHHLELWVTDLSDAERSWGWLLAQLGYELADRWGGGQSWKLGDAYVVLESGPDLVPGTHDRRRPGLNHVAFHAGGSDEVDVLVAAAPENGWTLMFPDRHPHAGGEKQYAAYLEDTAGFEVELVADDTVSP